MDNLDSDLKEKIKIQQSKKTKFYGLLIEGKHMANMDILSSFDENYFYTKGNSTSTPLTIVIVASPTTSSL